MIEPAPEFANTQQIAVEFLRKIGMEILDRDIRMSQTDHRKSSVHVVTYDLASDRIVFVTVTRVKDRSTKTRLALLHGRETTRKTIRNWLRVNRWGGNWRFDVVCVYGDGERPEIDHIENIKL